MDYLKNILLFADEIRLSSFIITFFILASCEVFFPRRKLKILRYYRWKVNLGIIVLNNLLLKIIYPSALVVGAIWANKNGVGIFNYFDIPILISSVASLLCLDLIIYLQHMIFHKVNFLWRIHRVHHVDLDLDITTGLMFHPLEILLSLFIKIVAVLVLGSPAISVVLFQIILNITSIFNHSNICLPTSVDRLLRYILVTPDMHLVHHSNIINEHNSNYGFNLSIWDKIFKTYLAAPSKGINNVDIGIRGYSDNKYSSVLLTVLLLPFKSK